MSFGDLSTTAGLEKLNAHLASAKFVGGDKPSAEDKTALEAVSADLYDQDKFANVARWHKEASAHFKDGAAEEDDDDVDLFGSDDEEEDAEAERVKAERLAAYKEKKAAKGPAAAAKSMVTLDIKGWDDETDMEALTANVVKIELDGLVWGSHQLVPVGYGINKLQINAVVEDAKVSLDELSELIQEDEDLVQSVDVAAMQKL